MGRNTRHLDPHPDGTIILTYYSFVPGKHNGPRAIISKDGGKTWLKKILVLADGNAPMRASSIALTDDTIMTFWGGSNGVLTSGG